MKNPDESYNLLRKVSGHEPSLIGTRSRRRISREYFFHLPRRGWIFTLRISRMARGWIVGIDPLLYCYGENGEQHPTWQFEWGFFEDIEYTATQEFSELYPNRTLPNFKRLVVLGKVKVQSDAFYEWSGDDFCLTDDSYLIVTNKALEVLKMHQLNYCDIKKLSASESYYANGER